MGLFCKFQWGESNWGDGHFIGVVRVLDRVCEKARLADVTPHTLRHTFASLAGDLGVSELMIVAFARPLCPRRHPDPGTPASRPCGQFKRAP
jgi:hypothetical protein